MNKKYKNVKTGAEREFTDLHWTRLPKSFKADWIEVSEFSKPEAKSTFIPPELATGQPGSVQPGSGAVTLTPEQKQVEEVKQMIAAGKTEKQIREATGLHHSTVKSLIEKANA